MVLKKIKKFEYPFYFESKQIAENFLEYHDKFELGEKWYFDIWGEPKDCGITLIPKGIKNPRCVYCLNDAFKLTNSLESGYLAEGHVWDGRLHYYKKDKLLSSGIISYLDIFDIENEAAKEGTDGETFSYKLQKV